MTMTPIDRLAALMADNEMTAADLAREAGCSYRYIQYWLRGERNIPAGVFDWLEQRLEWWCRRPVPPASWRRGSGAVEELEDELDEEQIQQARLMEAWNRG